MRTPLTAVAPIAATLLALAATSLAPAAARTNQTLIYLGDASAVTVYGDAATPLASMYGKHISPWGIVLGPKHAVYSLKLGSYSHHKHGSVAVFPSQNGLVQNASFITCHLAEAWSAALDKHQYLYVTDPASDSVVTFAPNASGCAQPASILSGENTRLESPTGIAIDSHGRIVVSAGPYGFVSIFAAGASGNTAPIASISGAQTGLSEPEGVAVDAQDHIWVTNYSNSSITEYAASANGNVAPIRTIAGAATQLANPIGIAVSKRTGMIYVGNYPHNTLVFAANAKGNAAPVRVIPAMAIAVAVDD